VARQERAQEHTRLAAVQFRARLEGSDRLCCALIDGGDTRCTRSWSKQNTALAEAHVAAGGAHHYGVWSHEAPLMPTPLHVSLRDRAIKLAGNTHEFLAGRRDRAQVSVVREADVHLVFSPAALDFASAVAGHLSSIEAVSMMRRAGTHDGEAATFFVANGGGERTFCEAEILDAVAMDVLLALSPAARAEHRAAAVVYARCGLAKWRSYSAMQLDDEQKEFVRQCYALGTQGAGKKGEKLSAPAAAQLMRELGLPGPARQYPDNLYFRNRGKAVFDRLHYISEVDLKRHFGNPKLCAGKKRAAAAEAAQPNPPKAAKTAGGGRAAGAGAASAVAAVDTDALIGRVVVVDGTVYRVDSLNAEGSEFMCVNDDNVDESIVLSVESVWSGVEELDKAPSPYNGDGGHSEAGQAADDRYRESLAAAAAASIAAAAAAAAAAQCDDGSDVEIGNGDY